MPVVQTKVIEEDKCEDAEDIQKVGISNNEAGQSLIAA
jgi:hypothetical protein